MLETALIAASFYLVKPGDSLWSIAGPKWPEVCQENHLRNCNLIYPGEKLRIGGYVITVGKNDPPAKICGDNDFDSDDISCHSSRSPHIVNVTFNGKLSGTLSCNGLMKLWDYVGGNPASAFIAAEIAMAESGGNQYATGAAGERGYWQINPDHGYLSTYNAFGNAKAAVILSNNGRNWTPWTTYTRGLYIGRCL